jgi:diguanylate cyclase (GGDEF)-like protein/PAS domain S-box-containing protein
MTIEYDKSASFWSTTDFARSLSEQLAIVFGALHEGVVVHDSTGRIIASNPSAQRILGLTGDQLAGVSALDPRWRAIGEDGLDFRMEAHPSAIARNTGKPVRNVMMGVERTDGTQIWVNVNAEPLRDPEGNIAGVVVGFTDITGWRETQQQLHSSSLQLASVFESLREGVVVRDLEGKITAFNPAAERMLGLSKDGTTGFVKIDPAYQQVHPDGTLARFEELPSARVLKTGEPLRSILMGIRNSGDIIAWHNVSSEPIRDAIGDIIGVVTSFTDCTEQLRNENALQRSNELLQAAQDTAHVGGWEWDVANDSIYWSEETYRLFETTRAEYTPTVADIGRFFDIADAPTIRQKIRNAIMSGQSLETEVELLTARGRRIWVRTMCTPTQVKGRTVKLSGAFQDITDRKHAERVQTALYKISNASLDSRNPDELYQRIHSIISELMPARNLFIALLDEAKDEVSFVYWVDEVDPQPAPRRFSDGGGLTNWVLKSGRPLLLTPDSGKDANLPEILENIIGTDSIDWLGVPLMAGGQAIGVLAVQSYTGDVRYDQKHLELLQFVSNEIATALERKRAGDLVRENEEKYRSLFDKSPVYITLIELPEGTFVEVNDACLAGFGYTREDVIGKTTLDFGAWEDPKQRELFFKTLQEKGKVNNFEAVMRRKDRSPITVLFTATRLRIGSRDYVLNLLLDVSERRLIETRLRDNEAKFRLVFDQSPSMIALLGCPDGEFVEVNDIGVETFGHVREAMIGRTSVELDVWVNPEDRTRYLGMLRERGTVRDFEAVLRRKNGEHFDVLFNGSIVTLGGRQYSLNSIKDITERKEADARLRESDQRFRDLVDSTDGIVWQADASTFVFDYVSNNAERLLGYPMSEWLQPGFWADHIVPEDRNRAVEFCTTCTDRQENHEFEYRFTTKDGRIVWLRDIVKVVSVDGKSRWLRGLMLDITTMKQTQQSLEQANLSLEQTQHLLEASQYAAQVGGWELDLGLNTLFWTDETYRIHDLDPREYSPSVDTAIDFYTVESRLTLTAALQLAMEEGTPYDLELELISAHGRHVWVRTTGSATRVQNRTIKIGGAIQDITERKRAEQSQQHYSHVLAMISAESPLPVALDALARFVEQQSEGALCSILLLSPDGKRLTHGSAPSLPKFYVQGIDGTEIGPNVGSCGAAAALGQPALAEDIQTHPNWVEWREVAAQAGLRSCWSIPIFSAERKVMGTFALYHGVPWAPTPDDEELLRRSTSLAALAIDRARHQEAQRLAKTVFEENIEGVMVTAPDDRILMVNKAFERLTGFGSKEAVGQTPAVLLDSGRHDQAFWSEIQTQLTLSGRWEGEVWSRRKNGEIYPVQMSIADVHDNAGRVSQRISIMTDVSLQKVQAARIEQLAFYDVLTGLPNRALFLDRLEHILTSAQRHGGRGAILFMDLDRFKEINDSKGHAIGDLALAEAARRFLAATRREETLARLGGDEFVLIAEGADHRSASLIASRLLQSLSEPLLLMGSAHSIGTSIGIAFYPDDGTTSEELIKHTDIAMYRAKSAGGGYRFYQAEMGAELEKRLGIAQKLGPAIEANQLQLYYQPKVELATGKLVGAEALLRWKDPELGWISPGEFIPIAEQRGMMNKLGDWVLREGCLQLRRWRDLGIGMNGRLAINVSAQQMEDPEIVGRMLEIVHEAGATPEWVELELTESSMMNDPEHTIEIMEFLAAAGFGLSIDDFGTGYSSLSYLKRFSADEIKIDISFVRNMLNDKNDYAIVNTIIAMAHSLGLSTTAEGVELEGQAEALKAMGCEIGQGYLFSRPEAPENFSGKWLSAQL